MAAYHDILIKKEKRLKSLFFHVKIRCAKQKTVVFRAIFTKMFHVKPFVGVKFAMFHVKHHTDTDVSAV